MAVILSGANGSLYFSCGVYGTSGKIQGFFALLRMTKTGIEGKKDAVWSQAPDRIFSIKTPRLVEAVGDSGDKLQTVLVEAERRIVQIVIQQVHAEAEAVIDGKRESQGAYRRPCIGVVP